MEVNWIGLLVSVSALLLVAWVIVKDHIAKGGD
jgi:hypothetical protein